MAKNKLQQNKTNELEKTGTFNKKHRCVLDELFQDSDFFDPKDLIQVKYEMLRRVKQDKWPVTKASETYGFSRFAYYDADASFKAQGLYGLLPKKKGPKHSHKLNDEILSFINERGEEQGHGSEELAEAVYRHFGVDVHPRSIGRAIARWKKKH